MKTAIIIWALGIVILGLLADFCAYKAKQNRVLSDETLKKILKGGRR